MKRTDKSNNKVYKIVHHEFTWEKAVEDTERELKSAEERVAQLKLALRGFKAKAAENAPVPGTDSRKVI